MRLLALLTFAGALLISSCQSSPQGEADLVVYVHDSLVSPEGLGAWVKPRFEKICQCRLELLSVGDAAQLVSRVQLETRGGRRPKGQVLWGLDLLTFDSIQGELDLSLKSPLKAKLAPHLRGPKGFFPVDYGVFAFMVNKKLMKHPPRKFSDLFEDRFRKKLLIQDPRMSTPGLAFFLYADQLGGLNYLRKIKSQWLTLTPGWDAAYGMFLKEQAPLVWSYLTSEAYHRSRNEEHFQAVLFEEGQPFQLEGAGILKGVQGKTLNLALKFVNFLQSPQVQSEIPVRQYMFPLRGVVPDSFSGLAKPKKWISLTPKKDFISRWKRAISP